jgi:hypothetical protein
VQFVVSTPLNAQGFLGGATDYLGYGDTGQRPRYPTVDPYWGYISRFSTYNRTDYTGQSPVLRDEVRSGKVTFRVQLDNGLVVIPVAKIKTPRLLSDFNVEKELPQAMFYGTEDGRATTPKEVDPLVTPEGQRGASSPIPEVVLVAPENTLYNFEWVPGVDPSPRINLAGDPNNPVLELRNLGDHPVVSATLTWSTEGQSTHDAFLSSPHFAKYKPRILDDGMYSLSKGGPSFRVADHDIEHVSYIDTVPSKISIPPVIWNGFALRFIANQARSPSASESDSGFRHDESTIAMVSLEYHSGARLFLRRFRVKARVTTFSDGALYGGFNVHSVPVQSRSLDNLRATLQLSVVGLPTDQKPYVPPLSLRDLFLRDLDTMLRAHKDEVVTGPTGNNTTVIAQVYYDFDAKSKVVGFLIPSTPDVYNVCVFLSRSLSE